MRSLIINADGYGFTYGNNKGIEEAVKAGVVTSISVNVNFPAALELPNFLQRYKNISVGVHLNPVVGRPVSPVSDIPSLVNSRGEFHYREFTRRLMSKKIALTELELELKRQVEIGRELAGSSLTHLDSHQNRHLYPPFFRVFLKVARTSDVRRMRTHSQMMCVECDNPALNSLWYYLRHPRRLLTSLIARYEMRKARKFGMRMADRLLSVGHVHNADKSLMNTWLNVIKNVPEGTSEIFCHPGYVDDDLKKYATYVFEREKELQTLTSSSFRHALAASSIRLISFHDI